eukprot:6676299-Alexandrium_andersonii.AAC.1
MQIPVPKAYNRFWEGLSSLNSMQGEWWAQLCRAAAVPARIVQIVAVARAARAAAVAASAAERA